MGCARQHGVSAAASHRSAGICNDAGSPEVRTWRVCCRDLQKIVVYSGSIPRKRTPTSRFAHNESEVQVLRWLHHIYNKRMFGKIHEIYASNCLWHGPLIARSEWHRRCPCSKPLRLVALIPDCAFVPQHICSNVSEEGGGKNCHSLDYRRAPPGL